MSDGPGGDTAAGPDPRVHRLLDMLVEEVSLVDRAANKTRFLVVKREEDMAKKKPQKPPAGAKDPAESKPSGDGGGAPDASANKPPKGKKPAKKTAAGAAAKAKKPPAKDPPDEEEEEEQEEEDENGKTSKGTHPKKDPDEEEEEEEEPEEEEDEEQEEEPDNAPATEDKPAGKTPPKKKATKDDNGAPELGPPDDEAPDDDETPLGVALAALDSLTQAVELLSNAPEDGSQLTKVAEDVRAAADAISSAAGIEPDSDENEEPPGEATVAGLMSSVQELLTKIESLTQTLAASSKTPATTPTITAETQAPPDLAGTLAQVAQSMKSIDATVKAQAGRLDALEKRAGVPNSQPAGERVTKAEDDSTSWPMDMNRPRDRASTNKAVSFHDD